MYCELEVSRHLEAFGVFLTEEMERLDIRMKDFRAVCGIKMNYLIDLKRAQI